MNQHRNRRAYLVISKGEATVVESLVYIRPHTLKRRRGQYHLVRHCEYITMFETEEPRLEPEEVLKKDGYTLCQKCVQRGDNNAAGPTTVDP